MDDASDPGRADALGDADEHPAAEVGERVAPPVTAQAMLTWLQETSEAVAEERLDADELIALLGELRQAATACANASDWALLAAREAGASLRQIAPVFGKGYVRAPAARLEKLHREVLSADQFLELMRRRMAAEGAGDDVDPGPPVSV